MAKKRVTIYIEGKVWDDVKDRAWSERVSASRYLENLVNGSPEAPDTIIPKPLPEKVYGVEIKSGETAASAVGRAKDQAKDDVRSRYKLNHPNGICPVCRQRNKECGC